MEPKVLIGLSTGEHIRRADFLPHFLSFARPDGTLAMSVHGQSPAKSRNMIAEKALEINATHVFFLDDDVIPQADTLTKLLKHADKDIVSALYLLRQFPHYPAAFDQAYQDGKCKYLFLDGQTGLIPVVNCGLGAVLIRTEVFKTLEKPWVRLGEIEKDGWCDDVGFFNRCRNAGFEMWLDLDNPVGHMNTIVMWPEMKDGIWMTNYKHQEGNVLIAQHVPNVREIKQQEKELNSVPV